jgi:integrase
MPKPWPNIYPRTNSAGHVTSWFVDCGGKERLRFSFKTKAEAEGKAELLRVQRKQEGTSVLDFVASERIDARAALEILRPYNVTLQDVARAYIRTAVKLAARKTVAEVLVELIDAKKKDECSEYYLDVLQATLKRLANHFGDRPVHEIGRHELVQWLYRLNVNTTSRKYYGALITVLFSFALDRSYVVEHPARKLIADKPRDKKPGILTVMEAKALLLSAEPDFVFFLALGLFAGLRPMAEIARLDWRNIKLDKRIIDVERSKNTMSHRYVRISDNLLAWLAPYADRTKTGGPIWDKHPRIYLYQLEQTRERAAKRLEEAGLPAGGLRKWTKDAMRHSFASYHSEAFKNSGDTSQQLGHGGSLKIFQRHYRDRVEEPEARAYWELYPSPKIVALPARA